MSYQPNESSAEVTERELLVQTLRLQEQASVSNISQLVECRKQLELARLQCQMLQNTIARSVDGELVDEVSELLAQEQLNLEGLTYDYMLLLEEERQWLMLFVRCFDEMNFPEKGLWKSFFDIVMEEKDFEYRQFFNKKKEALESLRQQNLAAVAPEDLETKEPTSDSQLTS
jgi:hypothetical protein